MNTSNLERQYTNLTVRERASLMIAAKVRGDESERKKLIASAECKHFSIWAEEESIICEAWFSAHMSLILLNMEQRIAELSSALASAWIGASDTESESDEKLVAQMFEFQTTFRKQRQATLLAFQDWMAEHELPTDIETLEACNVDFSICDDIEKNELRDSLSYQSFAMQFQKIGII